jgi:4-hydroxy-2-oxoheptanedioate aldolase
MGIRHFCVGWDVRILHDWFTDQGKMMQSLLSGATNGQVAAAPTSSAARTGYN